MPTLPSIKLNAYFDKFKDKEIAFNKSIIKATGLETKNVHLKIRGEQWPCILYSCSLTTAKIVVSLDVAGFEELKKSKNIVNLRLSFFPKTYKKPINFFVQSEVTGYKSFNANNSSSYLMHLQFSQKPPEDLIEIIGNIFQSIENFEKRRELRIALEPNVVKNMEIQSTKGVCIIDNIKRPCILKNVSATGAFIVMVCNPKFVINKKCVLQIALLNTNSVIEISGTILRSEAISGRSDVFGLGIKYEKEDIPFGYKEMINNYIDKLESFAKQKGIK